MGKASRKKREQREARAAEGQKLRIVVCGYPAATLGPSVELLKAGVLYADEVVLYHPAALILASFGAITELPPDQMVAVIADAVGPTGDELLAQLRVLEEQYGDQAAGILRGLLDPGSNLQRAIAMSDPSASASMIAMANGFTERMAELEETIEAQRVAAGIPLVRPAMDAGIVEIAPLAEADDMGDAFIESLWSVLRDRRCYPLLDDQIADLVSASIREGLFDPGVMGRARATQAGAASHFLARLPTFPRAGMDEILDVRDELARPLRKFRSQMVKLSRDLGVDAYSDEFGEAAEQAWIEHVAPALDELDELVQEMRLPAQFGAALPGSGAISAVGGLLAGILTGDIGVGAATGAAATAATGLTVAAGQRARLERGVRNHPYYFLHRTEQLLSAG